MATKEQTEIPIELQHCWWAYEMYQLAWRFARWSRWAEWLAWQIIGRGWRWRIGRCPWRKLGILPGANGALMRARELWAENQKLYGRS